MLATKFQKPFSKKKMSAPKNIEKSKSQFFESGVFSYSFISV
jgi:hypothetical protein